MSRSTLSGTILEETEVETYSLRTKVPQKWVVIDLETGSAYSPSIGKTPFDFTKSSQTQIIEAKNILEKLTSK